MPRVRISGDKIYVDNNETNIGKINENLSGEFDDANARGNEVGFKKNVLNLFYSLFNK